MPTYDSNITTVEKPSTSPSITEKPSAPDYTITEKATRPTTTKVPKPYTEPLAILTEGGDEILYESGITMTVEGAL